ncbi:MULTISPECIES: IscS subfamily cysteine desulfurase [unclassified Cytobacillus]|uniref:IscS subfamily cysteine desulfurase n=1 Tax=unclassified Cytobacillus TaxID=2675268 RepID=UPI00203AFA5A|nr:IscS subfamily cysteine desulfurase [Cytobacillus sp. AMY 15.2]MCM3093270.1 IscS subfamily cysteine desulfurase [Cytobacillus sp. AMY 15.2]
MGNIKYFDYAASCPLDREAADAYIKASTEYFGNTRSLHDTGSAAEGLLENCRMELAGILGVKSEGIYFTSGGSESNFLAIAALLSASEKAGKHIITGIAEHSSIHSVLEKLRFKDGYEITKIPFGTDGRMDLKKLSSAIREDTVLVTIQHGNPEIGTLQPLIEISELCRERQILLHSDCVHTFGKADLKEAARFADSLSFSAHKFYGPKGIGGVYLRPDMRWSSFLPGVSHEKGLRPGTVNLPGVVGMTVAAQKAYANLSKHNSHFQMLREVLLKELEPAHEKFTVYDFSGSYQLPSTLGLRLKGVEGQYVMLECNRLGFSISTGSACSTGLQTVSKTMEALGVTDKRGKEFIRISFGWNTSAEDAKALGEKLAILASELVPL